jgi:hypothetical protein
VENETIREAVLAGDAEEALPIPWDPHEYRAMVCGSCARPRVFRRRRIKHSFHFMLALGTLGVWLPVWGIVIVAHSLKPWTCIFCGVRQRRG